MTPVCVVLANRQKLLERRRQLSPRQVHGQVNPDCRMAFEAARSDRRGGS